MPWRLVTPGYRAPGTFGMKPERALIGLGITPLAFARRLLCYLHHPPRLGSFWFRSCRQPISELMCTWEIVLRTRANRADDSSLLVLWMHVQTADCCTSLHNRLYRGHLLRTADSPHGVEVPQYQRAWRLHSVGLNCSTVRSRVAAPRERAHCMLVHGTFAPRTEWCVDLSR